jgi:predicted nucleic acid-binding protein
VSLQRRPVIDTEPQGFCPTEKGEFIMRFVISLDVALRIIRERTAIPLKNSLLAPTLLRSQILSELFASVGRREFDRKEANVRLDHMRALNIRFLGDRVLQKVAWDIAEELNWNDTLLAEYVALTRLQADAFVTLDASLAQSLEGVVPLASVKEMVG